MSRGGLFSAHWHRVRDVRPRLALDVVARRHVYRGRVSWVLQRRGGRDCHRLDADAFALVDQLDGERTVGELWERTLIERDRDAPDQDTWMSLLAGLHAAELLVVDRRVPADALFERRAADRSRERRQRWLNPLYLRFSLHDPDVWLSRSTGLARCVFSRPVAFAWLTLMVVAIGVLFMHSDSLASALSDPELISPQSAWLLLALYPPLKLLHELGHALAVKRGGGAVNECGVALMVLMPLPYVDASASAAFIKKGDRMLVSAAGILVELTAAAVGALLWATTSGLTADAGLALLLVGGVSTLLINGNPLLKFDGYYLLADALEIPNLAERARHAVLARLRALLTGEPFASLTVEDVRERIWLHGYGLLSAIYRTGLMLSIAWMLAGRWPVLGSALAAYAVCMTILLPLWRGFLVMRRDVALGSLRSRSLAIGTPVLAILFFVAVPLPHASATRGVVWLPDDAVVRAAGACEVTDVSAQPGSDVNKGDVLFRCSDPELSLRARELQAQLDELTAQLAGSVVDDPVLFARLNPRAESVRRTLRDVRERLDAEVLHAASAGRFDIVGTQALKGRSLQRGDIAAYVVPPDRRTIRVAIAENDIADVDAGHQRIDVRLPGDRTLGSHVLQRTPRASVNVPSAALGTEGGGEHATDPNGNGERLLAPVFDVELAWPDGASVMPVGAHVEIRFVHPPSPAASRLRDRLRRAYDAKRRA